MRPSACADRLRRAQMAAPDADKRLRLKMMGRQRQ
jgi:hypothetical protein